MEGKRAGERRGEYGCWSVQRKKVGLGQGRERIYIIEHEDETYGGLGAAQMVMIGWRVIVLVNCEHPWEIQLQTVNTITSLSPLYVVC